MSQFFYASSRCVPPLLLMAGLAVCLPVSAQRNGVMKVSMTVLPSCHVRAENLSSVTLAGAPQVMCPPNAPFHVSLRQITDGESASLVSPAMLAPSGSGWLGLPPQPLGTHKVLRLTVAY